MDWIAFLAGLASGLGVSAYVWYGKNMIRELRKKAAQGMGENELGKLVARAEDDTKRASDDVQKIKIALRVMEDHSDQP